MTTDNANNTTPAQTDDPTEGIRRVTQAVVNATATERAALEERLGESVYDTEELQQFFSVTAFLAPFVGVTRKSDGAEGTMMFQHSPRYYWGFQKK